MTTEKKMNELIINWDAFWGIVTFALLTAHALWKGFIGETLKDWANAEHEEEI